MEMMPCLDVTSIPGHIDPVLENVGSDVVECGRRNPCDDQLIAIAIAIAAVRLFVSVLV